LTPRSVLIVTQFAPPAGFSAARRVSGLAKYLQELGHRVTVLTSLASGRGPVAGAHRVVRSRDLIVSGVNWRRGHFESLRQGTGASYAARPSRLASVVVPDLSMLGWLPFALPAALRVARESAIDCVLTTSPPESVHLVGRALQRQGLRWIADLRDGWTFETTHPDWPLRAQGWLDESLERRLLRSADLVTTVTEPITEDAIHRVGARAVTIPNGFDPAERVRASKREAGLSEDRHSLVHTGRMAFAGRTPEPLLRAAALLREREPALAERLEIVFAGPLTDAERDRIEARRGVARAAGTLPRDETLRLQSAADGLILLTGRDRRSEATAKLYEYLAAAKPILVLGEAAAAARVVEQTRSGIVTSATDPESIAEALRRLLTSGAAPADWAAADEYAYPAIAQRLSDRIDALFP
jgi:glycosyltransferase involved in cell wall biosynthesis